MFTFKPMIKKRTGRWDYTSVDYMGNCEPVGCCMDYWEAGNRDGHHATAQEAVTAFKEFIEPMLRFDATTFILSECAICKEKTFKACAIDDEVHGEKAMIASLCQRHLTKDAVLSMITEEPFDTNQAVFDKEKREEKEADAKEWEEGTDEFK